MDLCEADSYVAAVFSMRWFSQFGEQKNWDSEFLLAYVRTIYAYRPRKLN